MGMGQIRLPQGTELQRKVFSGEVGVASTFSSLARNVSDSISVPSMFE